MVNWGIVGAGKISTEFAKAISSCEDKSQRLLAVAANCPMRATTFARNLNVPTAYGSYKELAQDKQIDIVYIGNLNIQHFPVAEMMLQHRKSVLCEKPLTLNEKQTNELLNCARVNNQFLMEAVWSRCFPAYDKLRELLDSSAIGDVLYMHATFGRKFYDIDRLEFNELGGGTILDLGIYALQLAQLVFKGEEPINVVAGGHLNDDGVDTSANAILTYSEGKTAVMSFSATVELPNEAVICGTKGTIRIPRFWCPTVMITPKETLEFRLPKTSKEFKHSYTAGLIYEVLEVGACVEDGLLECPKMTHKESSQLARLMDKIRKGVGVKYECD